MSAKNESHRFEQTNITDLRLEKHLRTSPYRHVALLPFDAYRDFEEAIHDALNSHQYIENGEKPPYCTHQLEIDYSALPGPFLENMLARLPDLWLSKVFEFTAGRDCTERLQGLNDLLWHLVSSDETLSNELRETLLFLHRADPRPELAGQSMEEINGMISEAIDKEIVTARALRERVSDQRAITGIAEDQVIKEIDVSDLEFAYSDECFTL